MKVDFVCHDDLPYATIEADDAYAIPKRLGKFRATKRTEGISTTDVVTKILKDKRLYYERNIKRGATRKEVGLSYPKYWYYYVKCRLCPYRPVLDLDEVEESQELKK